MVTNLLLAKMDSDKISTFLRFTRQFLKKLNQKNYKREKKLLRLKFKTNFVRLRACINR